MNTNIHQRHPPPPPEIPGKGRHSPAIAQPTPAASYPCNAVNPNPA
jgi:hypothetical protein